MDAQQFGERIRLAREQRGLSQEDFAVMISKDQRAVSEYEHGKRRIAAIDLPLFAEALGVPLLYFFGNDVTPEDLDQILLQEFHRLPNLAAKQSAIDLVHTFRDALDRQPI